MGLGLTEWIFPFVYILSACPRGSIYRKADTNFARCIELFQHQTMSTYKFSVFSSLSWVFSWKNVKWPTQIHVLCYKNLNSYPVRRQSYIVSIFWYELSNIVNFVMYKNLWRWVEVSGGKVQFFCFAHSRATVY